MRDVVDPVDGFVLPSLYGGAVAGGGHMSETLARGARAQWRLCRSLGLPVSEWGLALGRLL